MVTSYEVFSPEIAKIGKSITDLKDIYWLSASLIFDSSCHLKIKLFKDE